MGAFESGQAFLAGVLAKLPENLRTQAKTLFEDPTAKDAVIVVGDGALARPDYSKAMDELKTRETELQTRLDNLNQWFTENEAALKDYVAIKPEYDTLKAGKGGTPPPEPPPADPRKVVEEVLGEQGPAYVQVSAWLAAKAVAHSRMFGEELDTMALVSDPRLGRQIAGQPPGRVFSLPDLYAEKFGERVAQKAKEAEDKRFNDEVEKRYRERLAQSQGQPFPLRNDASPSVLDVLTTKEGPAAHTLDSAVAEYERLQAEKGARPS